MNNMTSIDNMADMQELTTSAGASAAVRTPHILAAEINTIKCQTGKVILHSLLEIGRRLKEAKSLVAHGEWGKWLEHEVSYTQRTAQNLMSLHSEYGKPQPALPGAQAQVQEMPDLSYTQALILLGVPEEERVQFIDELDIDSISTRELKKAVEERRKAQHEKEQAERESSDLKKVLDDEKQKNTQLASERDDLKQKTDKLQKSQQELEQTVQEKALELKKLSESANIRSYQRVSNELAATQIKLLTGKIAFRYEALTKALKELTYEMDLLLKIDKEVHAEYAKTLNEFLIKAIEARMGKK